LGIKLARRTAMGHVLVTFMRTRFQLARMSNDQLRQLPEAADPADLVARELIGTALVSMYRRNLSLYLLLALTLVRQSIRGGNSPISPFAYATYCVLLISVLGDTDEAMRFADVAMELAERDGYQLHRPKAGTIVYNLIRHWRSPLRECIAPLDRIHQDARQFGDPEYGGLACVTLTFEMTMVGMPLEEVERKSRDFSEEYRAYPTIVRMIDVWREAQLNLLGRGNADATVLGGQTAFDEKSTVQELENLGDHTTLCGFHIIKTMIGVVFQRYEVALEHAALARRHLSGLTAAPHIPYFHFYEALAILGDLPESGVARASRIRRAQAIVKKLITWGKGSPLNYEHRANLASAELAQAKGDELAALRFYELAMQQAARSGFVHDEALACELAAKFHAARGNESLQRIYLTKASACYRRWGALGKVDALRAESPWLDERADADVDSVSQSVRLSDLDLSSLLEASQTLSQELNYHEFLAKLLATAVLSSGAQRATLMLDGESGLCVRARLSRLGQAVELADEPVEAAQGFALSVVRYVQRSRAPLVIGSSREDQRFARDPHVVESGVASILSVPIITRQECRGILYLESDVAHAFGSKRLRMLEALSGQMAASLENAELHTRLQGALQTQIELTNAHERFVPHQFLSALGRKSIKDVGAGDCAIKEMSVLYSDMRAFTSRLERMDPKQSIEFINGYIRHVEAPILAQNGFIDSFAGDAILALFDAGSDSTVRAALGMLRALGDFNRERGFEAEQAVRIGIGINTGTLILGTIGGHNRIKCGVVGDSVNVAARIEGLTKTYHAPLLIGDSTYNSLSAPGDFKIRLVDAVRVKGRDTHVTLYEVFDQDPPELLQRKLDSLDLYYEAVEHYRGRRYAVALPLFMRCRSILPEDQVLRAYAERCDTALRRGDAAAQRSELEID
jgi:class 3 adenylate cyclase